MPPLLVPEPCEMASTSWASVPGVSTRCPLPAALNTRTCGVFLTVAPNQLEAVYTGQGQHSNDCGAAHGDAPVPDDLVVYYFEVEVLNHGARGTIGIGFSGSKFNMTRQPGWERSSFGYHGDDGKKYHDSGRGEAYGPPFSTGDVAGAGIILSRGEVFFTKNGVNLGQAYKGARLPLFPTVAMHSPHERIQVNFGMDPSRPFAFDVAALVAQERAAATARAATVQVPPGAVHAIVRDFLQHQGHMKTLAALDAATADMRANGHAEPMDMGNGHEQAAALSEPAHGAAKTDLLRRAAIRRALLHGDVDAAEKELEAAHNETPLPKTALARARAALVVARFLETVRSGNAEIALEHGRRALQALSVSEPAGGRGSGENGMEWGTTGRQTAQDEDGTQSELRDALLRMAALLPYADLSHEETLPPHVRHLLSPAQRESLADVVNDAVLAATSPVPFRFGVSNAAISSFSPAPALISALQHLVATQHAIRDARGGQGEIYDIDEALRPAGRMGR